MAILNYRSPRDPNYSNMNPFDIGIASGSGLGNFLANQNGGISLGPGSATKNLGSVWDRLSQQSQRDNYQNRKQELLAGRGAGPSTTDQIIEQLLALQDPSRYGINDADLEQQARAAAAQQYDPQIAELRRQMQSTQDRGNRNRDMLGVMFNQLSDSINADIPVTEKRYDDTRAQTQQLADNTQQGIKNVYAQTQADQEALWKRLNIEAAAPDIAPEQQRDRDFFLNQTATQNQTAQNALNQEEGGAVQYSQMGAQSARREGTQRQADLSQQLFDLMNEYQAKIGDFEGAKNNAYLSGLGDLRQQAQKSAIDSSQRDFQNYISAINLRRGLEGDKLDQYKVMAGLQGQKASPAKSLADVAARAQSFGLNTGSAQRIQSAFNMAVMDDVITGGMDPFTGSNLTPEAKAKRVIEQGQAQGLNSQELNALQAIALEYFGRA